MKKLFFVGLFILSIYSFTSAQFTINVLNGYGGGTYRGTSNLIHIWAAANPPNMVFDKWVGDTNLLVDVNAWHTRVSLKKKVITLTATYKSAPNWSPTYETINGRNFGYYFPPNIRGLVFRFHGTGGNGSSFFNSVEDRVTANDLVAAGFAVASPDSDDRVNKQWDATLPPNNVDINNVQAIINSFISRGLITANTSIFSLGMSNGGAFSPRVAYALQFKAAATFCAQGGGYINITNVPQIWNMAQYDDNANVGSAGNAGALANAQFLASRGIVTQYNVNPSSPVYPERFARIPGLTLSDSQIIFNSLKSNGFMDGNNYLLRNPDTSGWESFVPTIYNAYRGDISDELDICYARHKYYSDFDSRLIQFFNARL